MQEYEDGMRMGSIFVPELGFIWEDEMSPAHRTPARNNNPSARNIRTSHPSPHNIYPSGHIIRPSARILYYRAVSG